MCGNERTRFWNTVYHCKSTMSPVKASPWIPLDVISGLRLSLDAAARTASSRLPPLFLRVENPPKPWSKIPSWKPRAPLRLDEANDSEVGKARTIPNFAILYHGFPYAVIALTKCCQTFDTFFKNSFFFRLCVMHFVLSGMVSKTQKHQCIRLAVSEFQWSWSVLLWMVD